ncbi:HNH endonuclease [Phenylobacterium sp.]|uniref:HNH endonuclease n=1 Tax=Phenylobacterium sp. TaxID=1871053 RepID=UPI0030F37A0D
MSDETGGSNLPAVTAGRSLVQRSSVTPGLPYNEYRQPLRHDFFCSCAYCTISEAEAQSIRFTIDHYEPQRARPDLENEYGNLLYACDTCNIRKGDRYPPPDARDAGTRFFRPDEDLHSDHFELSGIRLKPKTETGDYSIEALDLNRLALRTLRELRLRLIKCNEHVLEGIRALRRYPLDQLPRHMKGQVHTYISNAQQMADQIADEIDSILRMNARSPLLDQDPDADKHAQERAARLAEIENLHPGVWRGRQLPKK